MKMTNQEQLIMEAAEELFLEKGFTATSTTEIARKAECNQALVHYYFRTKEKLFYMIFLEKFNLFYDTLKYKENSEADFFTRLRNRVEAHFDVLLQNPRIPYLIISELFVNKERRQLVIDLLNKDVDLNNMRMLFECELNREVEKGTIRHITFVDLVLNVVSLNVMTFVAMPMFEDFTVVGEESVDHFISKRKEEIWETIYRSIRV